MTTVQNLPVYTESYDLLLEFFRHAKNFTKEYKYTLGEQVKNEIIALVLDVYRANSSQVDRVGNIQSARERVEVFFLLLGVLRDLHQLSIEHFVALNTSIESVSRQLSGWLRKSQSV